MRPPFLVRPVGPRANQPTHHIGARNTLPGQRNGVDLARCEAAFQTFMRVLIANVGFTVDFRSVHRALTQMVEVFDADVRAGGDARLSELSRQFLAAARAIAGEAEIHLTEGGRIAPSDEFVAHTDHLRVTGQRNIDRLASAQKAARKYQDLKTAGNVVGAWFVKKDAKAKGNRYRQNNVDLEGLRLTHREMYNAYIGAVHETIRGLNSAGRCLQIERQMSQRLQALGSAPNAYIEAGAVGTELVRRLCSAAVDDTIGHGIGL